MLPKLQDSKIVSYLSLFSSFGTLICCALPSTLVLLGFGATVASFLGQFPQLIWLSENKGWVFGISFFMMGISYLGQRWSANMACPIDKKEDCTKTKSWAKKILLVSFGINCIGVFYAFVLPRLM